MSDMIYIEGVTPEQKEIVAHQALAYVNYDLEKEKLSIVKPDVIEHSGVVQVKRAYDFVRQ